MKAKQRIYLVLLSKYISNRIGEDYVRNTGYNEVAELNDVIIIYPQTIAKRVEGGNNLGCWDW